MRCEEVLERLDQDPGDEEIRRHLEACPDCRREADAAAELVRRTAGLGEERPPAHDLWPAIQGRLAPRGRSLGPMLRWAALAAAAMVIFAIGVETGRPPAAPAAADELPAVLASNDGEPAELAATVLGYQQTRDRLKSGLERGRDRLDPELVAMIDRNLADIDHALTEIRAALEAEPADADLLLRLADLHRTELHLLRQATELAGEA